jgi:predicted alpha/beta-fold hydrolase
VTTNPAITPIVTADGGHCAFVERAAAGYDGYWAEREIVRFIDAQARR